jgi:hypothetical protein
MPVHAKRHPLQVQQHGHPSGKIVGELILLAPNSSACFTDLFTSCTPTNNCTKFDGLEALAGSLPGYLRLILNGFTCIRRHPILRG